MLRRLAEYALDINALSRLSRSVAKAIGGNLHGPLTRFHLALLSNATTDLVVPALVASAARYGVALSVAPAPFGMTVQAAMDPTASIWSPLPDGVLVQLDYRAFFGDLAWDDAPEERVETALAQLDQIISPFKEAGVAVFLQSLAVPPQRFLGSADMAHASSLAAMIRQFNGRLARDVIGAGVYLVDIETLAAEFGLSHWFSSQQWFLARLPFAQDAVPAYADRVARVIGAVRGRSRKVLVLDLDNTLWGGVIGDDGIKGIRLGQGDPVGEAHLEVQKAAAELRNRGILLAISSKNDDNVAMEAIRKHPDMVLMDTDFAATAINWSDKASNIEQLAKELSLGLDSFVFMDDNPAERAQVRTALPDVAVLELPKDAGHYADLLRSCGLFEATSLLQEDRQRADQYRANADREKLKLQSRDISSFLESLDMSASFTCDPEADWSRFTQLINKSNQFNLTTRRYTESDILQFVRTPRTLALQVRLKDRFGDNGMISAIMCRPEVDIWHIETWVMSCRVLGRRVEAAVLNALVEEARKAQVRTLRGVFIASGRNDMVREHYLRLGFRPVEQSPDQTSWEIDVATYVPLPVPIRCDAREA